MPVQDPNICACGAAIDRGRVSIGLTRCLLCALAEPEPTRKGLMVYEGKNHGTLELMTERQLQDFKAKSGHGLSGRGPAN